MPDLVTVHETRGLFSKSGKVTGITVELGENRYNLAIEGGRLKASVALVVGGVKLTTQPIPPNDGRAAAAGGERGAAGRDPALAARRRGAVADPHASRRHAQGHPALDGD